MQDDPLRAHYVLIPAFLSHNVSIETLANSALPQGWRAQTVRDQLRAQALGGECLRQSRGCVLAVPSAQMPAELNFLINPLHPDFKNITLAEPEPLDTDLRLTRD